MIYVKINVGYLSLLTDEGNIVSLEALSENLVIQAAAALI